MRNAEEPGAEAGEVVQLANVLVGLQEHVLAEVERIFAVIDDSEQIVIDAFFPARH